MKKKQNHSAENVKILWFFFKNHKFSMTVVCAAMIVSGVFESLNFAALYPILNHGLNLENTSKTLQFLDHFVLLFGGNNLFLSSCYLLIVISCFTVIAKVAYYYLSNDLIRKISAETENTIFQKYLKAEYRFFTEHQQGKLVYAGTVGPIGVLSNMLFTIRLFHSAFTALFFIILIFLLSWEAMGFVAFLGMFYVLFIRKILKQIINKHAHLAVLEDNKKNVILNEFISGIKTIRAFFNNFFWQNKYQNAY